MLEKFARKMDLMIEDLVTTHVNSFYEHNPHLGRGELALLSFQEITDLLTKIDADSSPMMYQIMDEFGIEKHTKEVMNIILKAHGNSQRHFMERTNIRDKEAWSFDKLMGNGAGMKRAKG